MKLILVFAMLVGTEALSTTQSIRRTSCMHRKTYPHRECHKYYSCDRGQLVLETCDYFYVYSTSLEQCVLRYSRHDHCTKKTNATTKPTTTWKETTTTESFTTEKIKMHQIDLTTTTTENPSASQSTFDIDWLFTTESTTTTENNQIEMQQNYITPDTEPDVTNEKINTKQRDKITTKLASTTTTEALGSPAQNCIDRVVYSDQNDCRQYYYCNDGILERRKCFLGYVFSRRLNHCVIRSSDYADCRSVTKRPKP